MDSVVHLDEHDWLLQQSAAAAEGDLRALDLPRLAEYLYDMAKRDEREVKSRLMVLLQHLLKAQFQPERMSGSWNDTLDEQQDQLRELCASLSLEGYAVSVFRAAYTSARKRAARETELPFSTFPEKPLWTLRDALRVDLFGALDR